MPQTEARTYETGREASANLCRWRSPTQEYPKRENRRGSRGSSSTAIPLGFGKRQRLRNGRSGKIPAPHAAISYSGTYPTRSDREVAFSPCPPTVGQKPQTWVDRVEARSRGCTVHRSHRIGESKP
ncbi:hypothetical protein U1Q18_044529 [Sarracenia purpurea var. burkii]